MKPRTLVIIDMQPDFSASNERFLLDFLISFRFSRGGLFLVQLLLESPNRLEVSLLPQEAKRNWNNLPLWPGLENL